MPGAHGNAHQQFSGRHIENGDGTRSQVADVKQAAVALKTPLTGLLPARKLSLTSFDVVLMAEIVSASKLHTNNLPPSGFSISLTGVPPTRSSVSNRLFFRSIAAT